MPIPSYPSTNPSDQELLAALEVIAPIRHPELVEGSVRMHLNVTI